MIGDGEYAVLDVATPLQRIDRKFYPSGKIGDEIFSMENRFDDRDIETPISILNLENGHGTTMNIRKYEDNYSGRNNWGLLHTDLISASETTILVDGEPRNVSLINGSYVFEIEDYIYAIKPTYEEEDDSIDFNGDLSFRLLSSRDPEDYEKLKVFISK